MMKKTTDSRGRPSWAVLGRAGPSWAVYMGRHGPQSDREAITSPLIPTKIYDLFIFILDESS